MTAKGVVIDINGTTARVKCRRQSACASCHGCEASGACHAELIFGESNGEVVVDAINSVGAKVGDNVEVEASTRNTLLYSLLIFVFPCVISLIAYNFCSSFGAAIDACAAVLVAVFILSFFGMGKALNSFIKRKHTLEISKVLGEIDV